MLNRAEERAHILGKARDHEGLEEEGQRPLARRCITRHHYHHYRGFYATQRKLIEKEEPKRVKPMLYA